MKLVTTNKIMADEIREMCISMGLYTKGDNEEYFAMLEKARISVYSNAVVLELAQDIVNHSETKELIDFYGFKTRVEIVEHIAFHIINDCVKTFVEVVV